MNSIDEKEPPDKEIDQQNWKRPDKYLSTVKKHLFKSSVIKMRLNTFLKIKELEKPINQLVTKFNRIKYCNYHFLNIAFLYFANKGLPIPPLDKNFFYKACVYSIKKNNEWYNVPKKAPLYQPFLLYKKTMMNSSFEIPDSQRSCQMINQVSLEVQTSVKNHLNLNFCRRFLKYLKLVHEEEDSCKVNYIIDHVFGKEINPQHPSKFDKDQTARDLIQKYRTELQNPTINTVITENLNLFIPFYLKILKKFEEKESKTFSILPLKGTLIPGHIPFNNTTLLEFYRDVKTTQLMNKKKYLEEKIKTSKTNKQRKKFQLKLEKHPKNIPNSEKMKKNMKDIWNECFSFRRGEMRNHWFDYSFTTNGYDVSIIYKIPKKCLPFSYHDWEEDMTTLEKAVWCKKYFDNKKVEYEKQKGKKTKETNEIIDLSGTSFEDMNVSIKDWEEWDRYIGIDPGGRSLFTSCDQDGKILDCPKKEYRHLTGFSKREREINKRKDEIEINNNLKNYSFKVSNVDTYLENLKKVSDLFDVLEEEYSRYFYRKWKFTCHQRKEKTFAILRDRLTEGKRTIIGFGNCSSYGPKIRGCHMPVKGFRNYLKKCPNVLLLLIKEGYTTKMCFVCKEVGCENRGEVKNWKIDETTLKKKLRTIYGLRRCNNNECRITWNRDVVASKNINHLLTCFLNGQKRPKYLKKQSEKPIDDGDHSFQKENLKNNTKNCGLTTSSRRRVVLRRRSVLETSQELTPKSSRTVSRLTLK